MKRPSFSWQLVSAVLLLAVVAVAFMVFRINAAPGFQSVELPPDEQLSIVFLGDTLLGITRNTTWVSGPPGTRTLPAGLKVRSST